MGSGSRQQHVDIKDDGLLWLINRVVFHPRGYSLGYEEADRSFVLLGDGSEPWSFGGDGSNERPYLAKVRRLMP